MATHLGLPIVTDPELRERLISPSWMSDFRDVWRRSWENFSYALEGGETSLACRDRVTAAVYRIVRRHRGRTVVIGSHGNAISLFVSAFTPGYGIKDASALRNPELLHVTHGPEGYRWHRDFVQPAGFDDVATDFRDTPGITAG
jgi:2,3-bisphosphoglycerate-dependent phosphoglycerate mutase